MKVLVLGAGGVGGYFGTKLALAGNDVTFVARGAHRDAMARDGLLVRTPAGELHLPQPSLLADDGDLGPCDAALVCVKLWDLDAAAQRLKPLCGPETAVLPLQNGVTASDSLAAVLGPEPVLGGVAQIAAKIEAPGVIRQTGKFARLIFGERHGGRSARVEALHAACQAAGIDAKLSDSIEIDHWKKFVMLAPMAGAASRHRLAMGALLEEPARAAELRALVEEAVAVGRAKGVALAADLAEKTFAFYRDLPAEMKPSMLHDLEAGRRLELDWLNGEIVRLGESLGVETPAHRAVVEALDAVKLGPGA